nr:hypothetical protein [Candidatus Sigynarchaeota archaeon]
YTTTQFEGTSIWDLIEFTFLEIWNARLSGIIVDVDMLTIGTHRSVLLDYGGSAGLGLVALVNAGNKVAIIFNVARNSSWMNVSTFTTNIQAYVSGFLSPLREILYVAHFDQETILASSSRPVPSSISTAQAGSYLDHTEFLNIVEAMMLDIPESSYPFILNWNQLVMIIVIILAIGLIIYYSLMSYKKEKTKIPETASRDEPLPYS